MPEGREVELMPLPVGRKPVLLRVWKGNTPLDRKGAEGNPLGLTLVLLPTWNGGVILAAERELLRIPVPLPDGRIWVLLPAGKGATEVEGDTVDTLEGGVMIGATLELLWPATMPAKARSAAR